MKRLILPLLGLALLPFWASGQEALWLRYPSISPDGREVVFNYMGDLYKVSSQGGTAVPLTVHPGHDMAACWSPDGRQLAFASDRHGSLDVFVMPSQGGPARRLTTHSGDEMPSGFTPSGQQVIFQAQMEELAQNSMFPSRVMPELYTVPASGGRARLLLATPAVSARFSADSSLLLYHDLKGYEDNWRKHHQSSIARDLLAYDTQARTHRFLTGFAGEDREPVLGPDQRQVFFLSERSGSFNVHAFPLSDTAQARQLTRFADHPVRFLSVADDGTLCFSQNGELYLMREGEQPRKLEVRVANDRAVGQAEWLSFTSGASEMAVSPSGKEVAFVVRGEVFVASSEHGTTRRVTSTPEQERSVSFRPDGRALLYASERGGSWNLYQTELARPEEANFFDATLLSEKALLETPAEAFQPSYSPDGKEVAFLHERVSLRVLNLASGRVRAITDSTLNYSYSDGDQWYEWSPDGKWFLVSFSPALIFSDEVGLVSSAGGQPVNNLSLSGYADSRPRWMLNGNMVLWFTDRQGYRSHGSWGAQFDAYGMFLNPEALARFRLNPAERQRWKDLKKGELFPPDAPIVPEGVEDRVERLTLHPSSIADAWMDPEGEHLYYLSRFEKGYDLWVRDFVEEETKLLVKLDAESAEMETDTAHKTLYLLADGKIYTIDIKTKEKKSVDFNAQMFVDPAGERAYIFEHAWRQVLKKFYDPKLHGVDWQAYRAAYERFLPHIGGNRDFAEMLSEMLGELNASHTGAGYRPRDPAADATARLGFFLDHQHKGPGLRVAEVLGKGPLALASRPIRPGTLILEIDGQPIGPETDYYPLLNHKAGQNTLLRLRDPASGQAWDEVVKPISLAQENELLYERWVERRRAQVDSLSGGRLGYVHVRGMDSRSFREVYSEALGRHALKEGMVIDTRFNGGGWLHDDLATLFSGEAYVTYSPRGQDFGQDPMGKWNKPSALLVSESNYSDAHAFPYVYQTLGIGPVVGMPVPGTMTAVWWETQIDPTLYFGIPQVGAKDRQGRYLENQQLEPDHRVRNSYETVTQGRDLQLEKAVEVLLEGLDR